MRVCRVPFWQRSSRTPAGHGVRCTPQCVPRFNNGTLTACPSDRGIAKFVRCNLLAPRPMAGLRTLDPVMMVRIHRGQLELHPFPLPVGQFVGQFAVPAQSYQRAALGLPSLAMRWALTDPSVHRAVS